MAMKKKKNSTLYLSDQQPLDAKGKLGLFFSYVVLIAWALAILVPLGTMIISSFNGNQNKYISFEGAYQFSFKQFEYLFTQTPFFHWMWNTIKIAGISALLTLLFVSFTGYAYSRFRFKGKKASLLSIMLIQTIPAFAGITAYYAIHSIVSGVFPPFSRTVMLILIYAGGGIASNTFILKGYIDSISPELDDAAKIDGCSNMEVYRLIVMPIAKPMLAIIFLWSFIGPFMDYMTPKILLTNVNDYTLATGLYTLISDMRTAREPVFAAGGFLIAIPIVILFMSLQDQLVSGLSAGSVKG